MIWTNKCETFDDVVLVVPKKKLSKPAIVRKKS